MENEANANQEPAPQATASQPAGDAVAQEVGSVKPEGQAVGQAATDSEQGFTNVDPKTLPPALKAVYDNLYKDYQKKTTTIAERVKAEVAKSLDPFKSKAEQFDSLVNNEEFVKQWNEFVEKSQASQTNGQPENEALRKVRELEVEVQTQKIERQVEQSLSAINAFADAKDQNGKPLHPDFDKLSGFKIGSHSKSGDYDLLRTAIELAPGETPMAKLENGYQGAKAVYDAIFEEGKKAGMGRLNDKIKNSSIAPSAGSAKVSGYAQKRPDNALEALEMARKGLLPAQ